ncbi:MAG TPA: hypothetical protein DCW68_01045 [Rhodospirillaceae bacterium]|nr:MAG: hypothetical protein A2018_00570 [Alphaproteobacteria bacterium GWF2_58_20]HAU28685.1 hypothetical protein [Rhodospirillaceae bacterium]
MEKAATIPVRVLDSDADRAALLAAQVRALLPCAPLHVSGPAETGEIVLACLSEGESVPVLPPGGFLIALPACNMPRPEGAGLVLPRPFSMMALQEALQRAVRFVSSGPGVMHLSPGRVFLPQEKKLMHGDETIVLTEAESTLLMRLFQAEGREVSKASLLSEVLHYSPSADSHALETLVWRLRSKLGEDPGNPRFLCTGTEGYSLRVFS